MIKPLALLLALIVAIPASQAAEPSFEAEVWPYFKTHCVQCHGEMKRESEFRIDTLSHLVGRENTPQWAEVMDASAREKCLRKIR